MSPALGLCWASPGNALASRSLNKFKKLFADQIKLRLRFSLENLKMDDDLLYIPLFMADQTDRLIGLALEQRSGLTKRKSA